MLDRTKNHKVEEFAQAYARCEPYVVKQINKIFASTGQTMDDLIANAFADKAGYRSDPLTTMERIDHLITVAELAAMPYSARSTGIAGCSVARCGRTCKKLRVNSK